MRPESRREQLLTQSVGNELVIYDERTHDAHHLSPTAAQVWRLADGERDVPDLASALRQSIDQSPGYDAATLDEADSLELVRLALAELDRAGLLTRALPDLAVLGEPISRRRMLNVTAALLPVVASIVAPTPAMAISCTATLNGPFNVISDGGPITVTIATSCSWLMTSLEGYITPTTAIGSGNGSANFNVGANSSITPRMGKIHVTFPANTGSYDVTVVQSGATTTPTTTTTPPTSTTTTPPTTTSAPPTTTTTPPTTTTTPTTSTTTTPPTTTTTPTTSTTTTTPPNTLP